MTQRYNDIFGIKRNKRVEGWQSLTEFYQDEEVVRTYEQSRFGSGGGRLKHLLEVDSILSMSTAQTHSVLDLATGTGRISRALQTARKSGTNRFDQITAADYSIGMLKESQALAQQEGHVLSLVNVDAFNLPYADASFDAVICMRFIRHLYPDARTSLYQAILRVLKPGGLLIFDVCNVEKHKEQIATRAVYDELYTRRQFINEMTEVGFQVEKLMGVLYPTTRLFKLKDFGLSEEFVINFIRGCDKYLRQIPFFLPNAYLWMAKCRKPLE